MIWEIVKDERKSLRSIINLFNNSKLSYSSINYMFIVKVAGAKMRHIIDTDTAEQSTPQVNNATLTKTKSTLHKKLYSKIQ